MYDCGSETQTDRELHGRVDGQAVRQKDRQTDGWTSRTTKHTNSNTDADKHLFCLIIIVTYSCGNVCSFKSFKIRYLFRKNALIK